jgi:hypothetical protein
MLCRREHREQGSLDESIALMGARLKRVSSPHTNLPLSIPVNPKGAVGAPIK